MQWREVSENLDLRNVRRLRPGRFSRKRSKWIRRCSDKVSLGDEQAARDRLIIFIHDEGDLRLII